MHTLDRTLTNATLLCFLGMLGCGYYEHVEARELARIERLKQPICTPGDFACEIEPLLKEVSIRPVKLHRKRG